MSHRLGLGGVLAAALLAMPAVAGAQALNWPTEQPPQALPARDVKFPPYEIRSLANGLQVVVIQHHEQPVVTIRMLIRAGAASDPAKKEGVAVLTAALLDQGTTTRSASQIADTIDYVGGGLGTGGTRRAFLSFASNRCATSRMTRSEITAVSSVRLAWRVLKS